MKPHRDGGANERQLVLVVDIQDGLFQLTRDTDPHLYKNSALAHAELGKTFDIPVILTTSTETGMCSLAPMPHSGIEHIISLCPAKFHQF